jgi:hypothetical protein
VIVAMLAMDAEEVISEGLAHRNACCPGAAAAAIASVKALGASNPLFVGYSSSFEERPGDTFVGYGGVVFH